MFYATCAEAERAGFRPCKRCRPNAPALAEAHATVVARACRLIEQAEEPPTLDDLAQVAGMSRFHFHRVFKALTGVTPKAYVAGDRARRVREELASRETVTQAIYGAGFNSNGRFYAAAPGLLGMTPTQFRSGGSGNIGAALVAQAEPDGYTLLVSATPPLATNQSLYKELSYKPDEFVPITNFGSVPNLVIVRKGLPVNSVSELIAHAKANPGKLVYGSQGAGNTPHLTANMFMTMTGTSWSTTTCWGSASMSSSATWRARSLFIKAASSRSWR